MDLYNEYRPKLLKHVFGQNNAVETVKGLIGNWPAATMLTGPSGTGKTTVARIVRKKLGVSDADYVEVNASECRGIDFIRELVDRARLMPMGGTFRMWLIDEAHGLTGDAQQALLKLLEDAPKTARFVLCTTDPQKLRQTIRTRCTEIKFDEMGDDSIADAIDHVCTAAQIDLPEDAKEKIVAAAAGSARKAIVILQQIQGMDAKRAMQCINDANCTIPAFAIAQALGKKGIQWKEVAKILDGVKEDPEGIRRLILSYATTMLLRGNTRGAVIINAFWRNFFDTGRAGLVYSCYEAVNDRG